MADDFVEPPANTGSGNKVDAELLATSIANVKRQRVIVKHNATPYHLVALGSNNAASIKASAAHVFSVDIFNNAAYVIYVKLYNKVAAPAPAADTPQRTIAVQAGTGRTVAPTGGIKFAVGLGIAIVKGIADTDNTAVVASDCVVDLDYE